MPEYNKPAINTLLNKSTPVDADVMLLEDSEDLWQKKKVSVSALKSAAGLGDVDGPTSSTDNAITRFDGTSGKIIQDYTQSAPTIDDNGNIYLNETIEASIVENGNFDSDLTGWTGTSWTWETGGVARHTIGDTTGLVNTVSIPVIGYHYKVIFTIAGATAGTLRLDFGDAITGDSRTNGTYTLYRTGLSLSPLTFTPTTDFDGYLDTVSVNLISNGSLDIGGHITNSQLGGPIRFIKTLNNPTGNEYGMRLDYTVDKSVSGNDTGFVINNTDVNSPGESLIFDAQSSGVTKFKIATNGSISIGTEVISPRYSLLMNTTKTVALGIIGNAGDYANGIEFGENGTGDSGGIYWRTTDTPRVNFTTYNNASPIEFGNNWLYALPDGKIGIGTTTPTAVLHLKAGTATANTSPLKLTSGDLNTTAEAGAMEYNGTNLSFVPTGSLRENIFTGARGSITLTAGTTTTVTIAQAKTTSTIIISPTSLAVIALTPYVSTKENGSFVITTLTAAGTETLDYLLVN
jgi:hypothetical protein